MDPSRTWGAYGHGIGSFSSAEILELEAILESWYINSSTFSAVLDTMATGEIRLAKGNSKSFYHVADDYSAWKPDQAFVYFNKNGLIVDSLSASVLVHELLHQHLQQGDPDETDTITEHNSYDYDFIGPVVALGNTIHAEMGLAEYRSSSYFMQFTAAFALQEFGWSEGDSFTDNAEIDFSRMGDHTNNVLDMRNRSAATRDLIFGADGDDTIYGGAGNDHLYGDLAGLIPDSGQDTVYGGAGKDRLFGGDHGDSLFGEDDNDFLDSGLNTVDPENEEETLDGGAGNDILIMRGMRSVATGGDGADQFWAVGRGDGFTYVIMDAQGGDSLYWNGYRLLGGQKQVIELHHDRDDPNIHYADVGALDANGFRYYFDGNSLNIYAPDGSGFVIENFSNGMLGINVGSAITGTEVTWEWEEIEPEVWGWDYDTTLSLSSIADDNNDFNYASLPGFGSTLGGDGPNAIPTTWLP